MTGTLLPIDTSLHMDDCLCDRCKNEKKFYDLIGFAVHSYAAVRQTNMILKEMKRKFDHE